MKNKLSSSEIVPLLSFSAFLISSSLSLKTLQLLQQAINSKVSLLRQFLNLDIIRAPWEKKRSEEAEEAGIPK